MIKSIAPRRVRVVADDRQAFGVCRHVSDLERRSLVTAKFGVDFWYFGVFGESWAGNVHGVILARCVTSQLIRVYLFLLLSVHIDQNQYRFSGRSRNKTTLLGCLVIQLFFHH